MKSENQLFAELTSEESSQITGGFNPVTGALLAAARVSRQNLIAVARQLGNTFRGYFSQPGNGIIIGDRKGSFQDTVRIGNVPRDIPGNATSGSMNSGKWTTL